MAENFTTQIMTNSAILLVSCLLLLHTQFAPATATMTPELPNDNSDSAPPDVSHLDEKRNWQSLQGSWGKRAAQTNDDLSYSDGAAVMPLLSNNGGVRSEPQLKYSLVFLADAETLARLLKDYQLEQQMADNNELDDDKLDEKRNWKDMNAAWGKRRNGPTWNKFNGAWGKREPGWNNLKGMWGKRAAGRDWQKLQGGWGKRSMQF